MQYLFENFSKFFSCGKLRKSASAVEPNEKRIALFCHAGMMRVAVSHIFNLPYQLIGSRFLPWHTGVTAIWFDPKAEQGSETVPRLYSFGDIGHLHGQPH